MYLKNDILNNFTTTKKWEEPFAFSVEMAFARKKNRSSNQRCSFKNGVLRNFTKFAGKDLCQSLFFNKVVGLSPATLLNKRLWHKCFPVNFAKFLRTTFLQNTSGRLLLKKEVIENITCTKK